MESEGVSLCLKKSVDAISILLVDDDTACLAIVAAILKKFKYQVVTVKHAKDALCTLRIKAGSFDLVVSDVHMPDMNGFQLQQAIAREFNLPVVLMSADDREGTALKGLENGAAFFICKPVSPDDVKDLWQFAAMNKKSPVLIEGTEDAKDGARKKSQNDLTVSVSASSAKEDSVVDKESKRKSPSKEGSDENKGETSSQCVSQKRPKIIWTNSLHNRFLEAIRSIGLDRAVPKKILEVMNVPGLTRENVASHLQKYRIFLRRVSDASHTILYSPGKGSKPNSFESSLEPPETSNPSTLTLDGLSIFPYQKPQQSFPTTLFSPNSEASSGFGQPRLLADKGTNNLRLNIAGPHVTPMQSTFPAQPMIQGHMPNITTEGLSGAFLATLNPGTSQCNVSFHKNIWTPPPDVVLPPKPNFGLFEAFDGSASSYGVNFGGGEFIGSSIFQTTSGLNENNNANVVADDGSGNDFVADNNKDSGQQIFDVDYGMLLPSNMHFNCEGNYNVDGIYESGYSPFMCMSQLEDLSARPVVPLETGDFGSTLVDQVNAQIQVDEGATFTSSNICGDNLGQWESCIASFDRHLNQESVISSQPNESVVVAASEQPQQVLEGLSNFTGFNNRTQVSPIEHHNEDEFLEALLSPFGEEDLTLEGI